MKTTISLLLILFVTSIATPTIISLLEKNIDMSSFYSFSEEEESNKEPKEIKGDVKPLFDYPFFTRKINTCITIISENDSRHDNVSPSIFSPPPELS